MEREVEIAMHPAGNPPQEAPAPNDSEQVERVEENPVAQNPPDLALPVLVFGIVEVRRLKREIEALDEFIHQAEVRDAGKQASLPRVSRLLDALASDNNLNLLQPEARDSLKAFLATIEKSAPTINISFASDPSANFTSKIVGWLRSNVHPQALLQVGLQPTIAAGCIVRTANKSFDFSLRERFNEQRAMLLDALDAPMIKIVPQEAATQ